MDNNIDEERKETDARKEKKDRERDKRRIFLTKCKKPIDKITR